MFDSLWEEATESDWAEEERAQWYRERPKDEDYYRIQRELLDNGLTRKGQADAAAAPRGGSAHALGDRHRGQLPPAPAGGFAVPAARQPGL